VLQGKILVIAPRFPAINQPWMDTYFVQLLLNNLSFSIYSNNSSSTIHGKKVDTLGLKEYILPFSLFNKENALNFLVAKPFKYFSAILKCFFNEDYRKSLSISDLLKLSHFMVNDSLFLGVSIIHGHSESSTYEFLSFAKAKNIPLVLTFHGLQPAGVRQLDIDKRKSLYKYASKIIVNTNFAKSQVVGLGAPECKVEVLPQGLPIDDFPFKPKAAPKADELVRVISVGRYDRGKGQQYALIALRRLLNAGLNVELVLVGVGANGKAWLKGWAHKLSVQKAVVFLEDISNEDMSDLYTDSHLFVLASTASKSNGLTETQGVVIQEAQSSGLISIVTNVGGIPECVIGGENAVLIKDRSSKAIFGAVTDLLHRPNDWAKVQMNARRHVETHFSDKVIGEKMRDLLVEVVELTKQEVTK